MRAVDEQEVAEEVGDHYKFVHWFTGIDDLAVRLYVQHDTFHDDEVLEFDFSDESYPFTSENFHVFVEAHARYMLSRAPCVEALM